MIEFDVIFEGARVPTWLRAFERAPLEAVEDLLVGRADLGLLSAEEPSALLLDWLAGIGDQDGFAGEIDETLARWIDSLPLASIFSMSAGTGFGTGTS